MPHKRKTVYGVECHPAVWQIAESKKVPLRTAAYILGIGRVAKATELAGVS